jgi:hypothetical protein
MSSAAAPKGYHGMMELGGAVFTLGMDASPFNTELAKAETRSIQGAAKIQKALNTATKVDTRNLLYLSQGIEDLQYGLSAVVNNIPQLVMGMGMGAGAAGAISIAAVAVNQLVKHWDELSQAWGNDKALPKIREGIEGLTRSLKEINSELETLKTKSETENTFLGFKTGFGALSIKEQLRLQNLQGLQKDANAQLQAERDVKEMGPEHTKERKELGALVREVVSELNRGSEGVIEDLVKSGMTKKAAEQLLSEASRGSALDYQALLKNSPEFAKRAQTKQAEAVEKGEEKLRDLAAEDARRVDAEHKRQRIQAIEDKRELLEEQRDKEREKLNNAPKGRTFSSGQEYLQAIQQSAYDMIPKQSLETLKSIDGQIKELTKAIKKERRATFSA